MMNTSDADLIQRILDGDQDAFTTIVNKYQKSVHALVWRKIGDFHIAEEITQDVFLKVYKRLSTLKRRDHFPGWLYVIATRRCIAWLRKKQLPTKSLDAMSTGQLEELCYTQYEVNRCEETAIEHRSELVKRLLQKLPESERTVVTLYYLAEMTGEEISMFLGVSPNTVRSRLLRARQRLKKEESMIQEVLSNFQLAPNLTENIIREIVRLKPTSPSASKPWIPWGLSFSATFLVILMMGFGTRVLSRFQQPYSLNATSEMTVELIDAPVVLELERKPDALIRFGRADIPGKDGRSEFQAEPLLIAAAQADETDLPTAKPQWVQTKGPGCVSRAGLFLASDQTLYAVAKTGLYRLTEESDAWTLVSASGPNREFNAAFNTVMAEYGDTLYLLTSNELLASTNAGKTWNSLGARPEGRVVTLIITDTAMYLVLSREVFRSEDVGRQWESIGQTLKIDNMPDPNSLIWDALAIDNTLFVGTSQGLFQFTDAWKKLSVPTSHGIKSLAVAGDRIYVGTTNVGQQPRAGRSLYAAVFYSTDLGDSWTDITPDTDKHLHKIIAAVEVVPVGGTLMLVGVGGVLVSYDRGETWMDPRRDRGVLGAFPVVAVDESNFYITNPSGITRSTNGGATWHPFMAGMVNSNVPNLITVKNVLYALTPTEMFKSADGGESWKSVGLNANGNVPLKRPGAKVATAGGVLYASNSELREGVTLFRLSDAGDVFQPVEGVPDFEEDTLHTEQMKKFMEAEKNNVDLDKVQEQWKVDRHRVMEEWRTNGMFTVTDDTVFMEYRRKLFRWRRGETAWHDTGLEDIEGVSPIYGKGFTLAVSGKTVYAGKREGDLFLSQDGGDTWSDVTENLVFPFGHFKEILFAGSTAYVSTDMGVMNSRDGETWYVLTDTDGNRRIMDRIAVDHTTAYGVCDSGVYQIDNQTNTWKQIATELPHTAISLAVDGNTFYIGTKQNGVLRFQRDSR
ncbi:MAG: sigma-70 family RNA polymerase sigma factor [Candidatus Poribacteria bacterium]|nr:sigma-70 family RNA polymerase sigma factor [Candidatus Poribacteria bacterium]